MPYPCFKPFIASLPIKFKIDFEITSLLFKTCRQPSYLCTLLSRTTPSSTLRPNQGMLLKVPRRLDQERLAFAPRVCGSPLLCHCGPRFRLPSSKRTGKTSLRSALSSIDICRPAPWLSTGNVKGLTDDGRGMASALELNWLWRGEQHYRSFKHSFIHSFIYLFIIYLFIHSFIHSFIHVFR